MIRDIEEFGRSFKLDERYLKVLLINIVLIGTIFFLSIKGGTILEKQLSTLDLSKAQSTKEAYEIAQTYLNKVIVFMIIYAAINLIIFTSFQYIINYLILERKQLLKQYFAQLIANIIIWASGFGLIVWIINAVKTAYSLTAIIIILFFLAYISINAFVAVGYDQVLGKQWKNFIKTTFSFRTMLAYCFSLLVLIALARIGTLIPAVVLFKILWTLVLILFLTWAEIYLYAVIQKNITRLARAKHGKSYRKY